MKDELNERILEKYDKILLNEMPLKGNQLWMAHVQLTKSGKTKKARNDMKKWAEANGYPGIWDLDPQRAAIDLQVFDELRDEFPDFIQARGSKHIYIKKKGGELKQTKIA